MPKLNDFSVFDFSGGVVRNRSSYANKKNEVRLAYNFDFDDFGVAKRRKGSYQFGTTPASSPTISYGTSYIHGTGGNMDSSFLIFSKGSNANCYRLFSTSLTGNITTASTTANVIDNTGFAAATSTLEINGDIITYTAVPSATAFTVTASTILKTHYTGAPVNQWSTAVASGVDARSGLYGVAFSAAGSAAELFLGGRATMARTTAGASFASVTSNGSNMFLVAYRSRIYGVGDGGSDTNSSPLRVAFSNYGVGTTWTAADFFDVRESLREMNTGLRVLNDNLIIFKNNSLFTYNEYTLKQRSASVGAYNNEVIQEIDGLLYTFCPQGVFVTNGVTSKKISQPVEDILKLFRPRYDLQFGRIIDNCCSGQLEKKYILYLTATATATSAGSFYFPNNDNRQETINGIALVYDTVKKNWTIYTTFNGTSTVNFTNLISLPAFRAGNASIGGSVTPLWQPIEALFACGGTNSNLYRLFSNSFTGGDSNQEARGDQVIPDDVANSAGRGIPAVIETPFYDLGNPSWWKKFGYIRTLLSAGELQISYRIDRGQYITDWISLGEARFPNQRFKIPEKVDHRIDNQGYRIAFRFSSNQAPLLTEFNGFILEDNEAIDKQQHYGHQ